MTGILEYLSKNNLKKTAELLSSGSLYPDLTFDKITPFGNALFYTEENENFGQWFQISLKRNYVKLKSYKFSTVIYQESITSWIFSVSYDGIIWKNVHIKSNENVYNGKTFNASVEEKVRFFKWTNLGPSLDNRLYILKEKPPLKWEKWYM